MTDVVGPVATWTEPLQEEAAQIEREVQRLLADVRYAEVKGTCHVAFWERFMELLKRRGEVLRKVLILFEESESVRHARGDQNWRHHAYGKADARHFLKQVSRREKLRARRRHRRCEGRLGIFGKQRNRIQ